MLFIFISRRRQTFWTALLYCNNYLANEVLAGWRSNIWREIFSVNLLFKDWWITSGGLCVVNLKFVSLSRRSAVNSFIIERFWNLKYLDWPIHHSARGFPPLFTKIHVPGKHSIEDGSLSVWVASHEVTKHIHLSLISRDALQAIRNNSERLQKCHLLRDNIRRLDTNNLKMSGRKIWIWSVYKSNDFSRNFRDH